MDSVNRIEITKKAIGFKKGNGMEISNCGHEKIDILVDGILYTVWEWEISLALENARRALR